MASKSLSGTPIIAVVGSITNDLIFETKGAPGPGETTVATEFTNMPGGKGANIATAAYRASRNNPSLHETLPTPDRAFGIRVFINGAVGDDVFGEPLKLGLVRTGLDVSGIRTLQGQRTGQVVIINEHQGRQTRTIGFKGANLEFEPAREDIECLAGDAGIKPDLLITNCTPRLETIEKLLAMASSQGVDTILSPSPPVTLQSSIYARVTHLLLNEHEAAGMSGQSIQLLHDVKGAIKVAELFVTRGTKCVVITLGGRGAVYASWEGRTGHVPALINITVVDTTGAGDSFLGAYAVDYLKQRQANMWNIERAIVFATKAAARTIGAVGAQAALPWFNEIEQS